MPKSYWLPDSEQTGDFSNNKNDTFDPKDRFIGIRMQQGKLILDRDWNELEDIRRYQELMLRRHYIGNGTPDDGFRISPIPAKADFRISRGRILVDGLEVVNEPKDDQEKDKDFVLYRDQNNSVLKETNGFGMVYLDVWIEEIGCRTDTANPSHDLRLCNQQDVKEDTCVRHKVRWQVCVQNDSEEYDKQEAHFYYNLAKINWTGGKITDVNNLRTTRLRTDILREELNRVEFVTSPLDICRQPRPIQVTSAGAGDYNFNIPAFSCILGGQEISIPKWEKTIKIPANHGLGILATSTGDIKANPAPGLTLGKWLCREVAPRDRKTNIRVVPLYHCFRKAGSQDLEKTDLRQGGLVDALADAIASLEKEPIETGGEQRLYVKPAMLKIADNPEWIINRIADEDPNYFMKDYCIYKPDGTMVYGVMPLNLPSNIRITKFEARGKNNGCELVISLLQHSFNNNKKNKITLKQDNLVGKFNASVDVTSFAAIDDATYIVLAIGSTDGNAEIYRFGLTYEYS